jgi:hypothetical protein
MQEIIVLGEIPGTNIQLSFTAWTYVSALVFTVLILIVSRPHLSNQWNGLVAQIRARKALRLLTQYHLL